MLTAASWTAASSSFMRVMRLLYAAGRSVAGSLTAHCPSSIAARLRTGLASADVSAMSCTQQTALPDCGANCRQFSQCAQSDHAMRHLQHMLRRRKRHNKATVWCAGACNTDETISSTYTETCRGV